MKTQKPKPMAKLPEPKTLSQHHMRLAKPKKGSKPFTGQTKKVKSHLPS